MEEFLRQFEVNRERETLLARITQVTFSDAGDALTLTVSLQPPEAAATPRWLLHAEGLLAFVLRNGHARIGERSLATEGVPRLLTAHPLLWRWTERIYRVRAPAQVLPEKAAISIVARHHGVGPDVPVPWLSMSDLLMRLRTGEAVGEVPEPLARAYLDALIDVGVAGELSDVFWSEGPARPDAKLLSFETSYLVAARFSAEPVTRPG